MSMSLELHSFHVRYWQHAYVRLAVTKHVHTTATISSQHPSAAGTTHPVKTSLAYFTVCGLCLLEHTIDIGSDM